MTQYEPVFFDIEAKGLNPNAGYGKKGQVICVGIGWLENWRGDIEDAELNSTVIEDGNEYRLFSKVRSKMKEILWEVEDWDKEYVEPPESRVDPEAFIVGFNSRGYDHGYYTSRCEGFKRQSSWPFGHHRKRLDVSRVVKKHLHGGYISQDDWAENIGLELHEDDITGKDVPELYENGQVDKIVQHCQADIMDLMKIFLNDRNEMMLEFYEHYRSKYSMGESPTFGETVTIDLEDEDAS